MRPGLENLLKLIIISIIIFPYSGNAQILPEQWPCDSILVHKIKETYEDAEHTIYTSEYYGEYQDFSLRFTLGGIKGYPYSIIQCGSSGCLGIINNFKIKKTNNFRFDCNLVDDEENVLSCYMIRCEQINATGIDEDLEELLQEYGDKVEMRLREFEK